MCTCVYWYVSICWYVNMYVLFSMCFKPKGRCTGADNLNLSVHFATFSVKISVGLKCTGKLHSLRLLTIWYR